MNYQNYYNHPGTYGYGSQQQSYVPQQTYQPGNYGFAFVNGLEDAKAFIVNPNCTYLLRDTNSNTCFEKRADQFGKWTIKVYTLVEQDSDAGVRNEISDLQRKMAELTALVQKVVTPNGGVGNEQQQL
jgi:hypothetical protein